MIFFLLFKKKKKLSFVVIWTLNSDLNKKYISFFFFSTTSIFFYVKKYLTQLFNIYLNNLFNLLNDQSLLWKSIIIHEWRMGLLIIIIIRTRYPTLKIKNQKSKGSILSCETVTTGVPHSCVLEFSFKKKMMRNTLLRSEERGKFFNWFYYSLG